jgi:hypothetical protein
VNSVTEAQRRLELLAAAMERGAPESELVALRASYDEAEARVVIQVSAMLGLIDRLPGRSPGGPLEGPRRVYVEALEVLG